MSFEEDDDDDYRVVRPYFLTKGRTDAQLAVEAMVQTKAGRNLEKLSQEQRQIAELCGEHKAIVEVSALLKLPLGVARVLVSDMVSTGILSATETKAESVDDDFLDDLIAGVEKIAATTG